MAGNNYSFTPFLRTSIDAFWTSIMHVNSGDLAQYLTAASGQATTRNSRDWISSSLSGQHQRSVLAAARRAMCKQAPGRWGKMEPVSRPGVIAKLPQRAGARPPLRGL